MSLILEDGALVYRAEALHFSGFVANIGDDVCRNVQLVFVMPAGVALPAQGVVGSDVAGAPRNATSVSLCEALAPQSRHEFHLTLPIIGEVAETAVIGSIGLASNHGSLGVGSLRCAVPRRPLLKVSADAPATLRAGGVAPASFVIWNVGRSAARGLWLNVVGDEELVVRGGDRDRGVDDAMSSDVAILGSLEVGESREVTVHVHSRGVGRAGTRCLTASVTNDDGENLWVDAFPVTVETVPALSVLCETVYDAMVDDFVEVDALVCSVGNGTASAVAIEVVPRGGVRLDAAAPDSPLQPAFTNGRRHLRGELGDLMALSQVRVTFRATIAPSREADAAGFDVFVTAHDAATVVRHVPVEARYLLGVRGETTHFEALVSECVPGDLLRVKLAIANNGTEALEDARVRMLLSSALTIEGLQDARSRVDAGTYFAGDVPPGVTHENVLLIRVNALPEGVTPMHVGGVLSAIGAYELPIGSAEVKGRAESYVALEGVIVEGGTVRFVVANRGDAETKRVDVGVICDDSVFVEPGTTRVGAHVLVDDGGHSPLAGAGVVLGAIGPGTSIPVEFKVISEEVQYAGVTILVRFAGFTIERRVEIHSLARQLVHTVADGYTIHNAVVARPVKDEAVQVEAAHPAAVVEVAVQSETAAAIVTAEPLVAQPPVAAAVPIVPLAQEPGAGVAAISENAGASTTEPENRCASAAGDNAQSAGADTASVAETPADKSLADEQRETNGSSLASTARSESDNEFVEHLEDGFANRSSQTETIPPVSSDVVSSPVQAAQLQPLVPPAPLLALPSGLMDYGSAVEATRLEVEGQSSIEPPRASDAEMAIDSEAVLSPANGAVIADETVLTTPLIPPITVARTEDLTPAIPAIAASSSVPAVARTLTLVPATLEVTATWLRGSVSGLAPLISSPARVLAMHALAMRFFVPDRFLAICPDDRRERIEDTLAGLRKASKSDAVKAAAFASAPKFTVTPGWLRLVDSEAVIQASRALSRSVDHVMFTEGPDAPDDARLIADVDVANLGATTRRFEASDAMATTWVFWNLLPTIMRSRPALGDALVAYRNALEEALYTASPSIDSLSMTVAPEVDLALERVRSELISLAAERGVTARTT